MPVFTAIDESGALPTGGLLTLNDAVYATAHDGAGGVSNTIISISVGQRLSGGSYDVYRAGLSFDTSSLGAGATIVSATLSVYGFADTSTTDFNLTVVSGADLADPLVDADYQDLLNATTSFGALSTSGFVADTWFDIDLNATGLAAISKTGITRFGLRSSRDISSTTPTGDEYIEYDTSWITGWPTTTPPKLTVNIQGEGLGIIAVVETRLHYVDAYGQERFILGSPVV